MTGTTASIGILGGSGLYDLPGLAGVREVAIDTPFGSPSDHLVVGELEGRRVGFLPRHGRGHRILPHEVNARANVYALKTLGVEWLISVSAVGSLKEGYAPRHVVVPDQYIDRTRSRPSTFFGEGLAAHVAFAHPTCSRLAAIVASSSREAGATVHEGGAYICIEGPQFSSRAESELYRSWGLDIIGMTALPEAKLAREAEICYATMALVTDYDTWHPDHDSVTAEQVSAVLGDNAATAKAALVRVVRSLPIERDCECARALRAALVTAPDLVPPSTREKLAPLVGKYLK